MFNKPVHSTSKPPPKPPLAAKKRFTGWSDENKEFMPVKNTTALGHSRSQVFPSHTPMITSCERSQWHWFLFLYCLRSLTLPLLQFSFKFFLLDVSALIFRVKNTSCTSFSDPQSFCTDFSMLSLPLFWLSAHSLGFFRIILSLSLFILLTRIVNNTRGIAKSCSIKEEHTTPRACENCNLGSPNTACVWRWG